MSPTGIETPNTVAGRSIGKVEGHALRRRVRPAADGLNITEPRTAEARGGSAV